MLIGYFQWEDFSRTALVPTSEPKNLQAIFKDDIIRVIQNFEDSLDNSTIINCYDSFIFNIWGLAKINEDEIGPYVMSEIERIYQKKGLLIMIIKHAPSVFRIHVG